jgi:hypothetical protein
MLSTVDGTRLTVAHRGMKRREKTQVQPPTGCVPLSLPSPGYCATWRDHLQIARGVEMISQYYGLGGEENETVSRFGGASTVLLGSCHATLAAPPRGQWICCEASNRGFPLKWLCGWTRANGRCYGTQFTALNVTSAAPTTQHGASAMRLFASAHGFSSIPATNRALACQLIVSDLSPRWDPDFEY